MKRTLIIMVISLLLSSVNAQQVKPTGQGIGLGLSLSYDIVKAHGGELRVETKEGEGSVFIIQFPVR